MPAPKKPVEKRQNRVTKDLTVVPGAVFLPAPAPSEGWRDATVARWDEFWVSPLAAQVEPSDQGSLRRLFWLYDELDRLREAIEVTGRVVEGSQGQPRPNPLYKQVESFQAEARQLEDRFGLSPLARLRLGITFADAQSSLDALNSQLARSSDATDPWELWDASEA